MLDTGAHIEKNIKYFHFAHIQIVGSELYLLREKKTRKNKKRLKPKQIKQKLSLNSFAQAKVHSKIDTKSFETETFIARTQTAPAAVAAKRIKKKQQSTSKTQQNPISICVIIYFSAQSYSRIRGATTRTPHTHTHSHTRRKLLHSFSGVLHIPDAIVYARVSHWFPSTKTRECLRDRERADRSDLFIAYVPLDGDWCVCAEENIRRQRKSEKS